MKKAWLIIKAMPPAVNHFTPLGISSTSPIQLKSRARITAADGVRAAST